MIASDIPTLHEVCGDAVLYADPGDPGRWALQMDRLAGDPGLRRDTADRGRRQAARFTWDRAAEAFIAAVRQMEEIR